MVLTRRLASLIFEDVDVTAQTDQSKTDIPNAQPHSPNVAAPFPLPHTTPTTPRSRKQAGQKRLQGLSKLPYDAEHVKEAVKTNLKLDFDIEDWQAHVIYRLLQGYDGVCIAGTGYGKSIIFEGLASMSDEKVVLVICPLKVLEKDQVRDRLCIRLIHVHATDLFTRQSRLVRRVYQLYTSTKTMRAIPASGVRLLPAFIGWCM